MVTGPLVGSQRAELFVVGLAVKFSSALVADPGHPNGVEKPPPVPLAGLARRLKKAASPETASHIGKDRLAGYGFLWIDWVAEGRKAVPQAEIGHTAAPG